MNDLIISSLNQEYLMNIFKKYINLANSNLYFWLLITIFYWKIVLNAIQWLNT